MIRAEYEVNRAFHTQAGLYGEAVAHPAQHFERRLTQAEARVGFHHFSLPITWYWVGSFWTISHASQPLSAFVF